MTVKFEVGKKYKFKPAVSTKCIVTCIAFTSRGVAVLEWDHNGLIYTDPFPEQYTEYVEPKRGTVWVNVYPDGSRAYESKFEAEKAVIDRGCDRIACIEVPWVEGQGL